ncbi:MAG: tyrosine-type recombinase/integrase, partial [Acidobacteriota bacterium]
MGVKVRPWPDGHYVVIHIAGKRFTKKFESEKTARDAADWMRERIQVMGLDGLRVFSDRLHRCRVVFFRDYAAEWLKTAKHSDLKGSTVGRYESSVNHQLLPSFGGLSLDEIDYSRLKAFCLEKAGGDSPLSRDSIRLAMVAMRQILSEAKREGLIETNPVEHLTKFYGKKASKEPDPLASAELAALETVFAEKFPEYYEFFLLAWKTGLRFGEQRALYWSDVDLRSRHLLIRRNWPANQSIGTPKTSSSVRKVDLAASLIPVLKGLRARRKSEALADAREMGDWVFLDKGEPIDHSRLSKRIWRRACSAAEVRWRSWHQ